MVLHPTTHVFAVAQSTGRDQKCGSFCLDEAASVVSFGVESTRSWRTPFFEVRRVTGPRKGTGCAVFDVCRLFFLFPVLSVFGEISLSMFSVLCFLVFSHFEPQHHHVSRTLFECTQVAHITFGLHDVSVASVGLPAHAFVCPRVCRSLDEERDMCCSVCPQEMCRRRCFRRLKLPPAAEHTAPLAFPMTFSCRLQSRATPTTEIPSSSCEP